MTKTWWLPALAAALFGCGGGSGLPPADAAAEAGDGAQLGCVLGSTPVATTSVCGQHPELCGEVCSSACVKLSMDPDNCGACGFKCAPRSACNDGVCGEEPQQLVAPAPGCRSLRLVHEGGAITWSDMGHGTIKRVSTEGGPPTTLASGRHPAAIFTTADQPLFVNNEPVGAAILVRDGTVYWIEADDAVTLDDRDVPHGGAGTSIMSVRDGAEPKTLLPAALAPAGGPLSSIALAPDGATLYFGAGTKLYAMPSAGALTADDVRLVGFTSGPDHGFATALAADTKRLYFPSSVDTWVEMFDLTATCDPAAPPVGGLYACPSLVFGSHPIPLLDTVTVQDGQLYWAKENNVWRADLSTADPALDGHETSSDTVTGFGVTGFAVGPTHAYFGENVYVERGTFSPVSAGGAPPARTLARGQTWPSSFALDGTNVYWTTTACDIAFIADSPQ